MAQPPLSIADQLDRVVTDLDHLIRDERMREGRLGARAQQQLHEHEARAQAIAAAIVAPFRGAGARPVNPPIGRTPAGGYAW